MPLDQVYLLLLASYFIIQKGLRFGNGTPAKKRFKLRFTVWKNNAVQGTKDRRTVLLRYIAYCFDIFVPLPPSNTKIVNMPNTNSKKTGVIIPTYQHQLNKLEQMSFDRIYNTLSQHDIILIKPHSLDFKFLLKDYPRLHIQSFDESYFHGHNAHNRLMLSEEFYERFASYEYILFSKLGAYIFEDKLLYFCDKDYDYVSSLSIKKESFCSKVTLANQKMIGCESLSLRKVESHLNALKKNTAKKEDYLENRKDENLFWTYEVPGFHYPSPEEVLSFIFDQNPKQCYALNNHNLPFACCNWHQKGKVNDFWKKFIKV